MSFTVNKKGTVCCPQGFQAAGVTAGLKRSGLPDMALITSDIPAEAAAAFTVNVFAAAPVQWDRAVMARGGKISAVIVNSGNANACTGPHGLEDARNMAAEVATRLQLDPQAVLVSSTGRIGVPMPMGIINQGIKLAVQGLTRDGGDVAARAIMTTDTVPKHLSVSLPLGGVTVTIGGMTKGSGMIAPQMRPCQPPQATMLAYVTTDAAIERSALQACLARSLDRSFNRIIVDGDTSTNDTFIALANGAAGNALIHDGTPEWESFCAAFDHVVGTLAKEMVLDGEGVTRFVELNVHGAPNADDARRVAEAIARSPLCKTAWFGGDPNWGRILAAAGYSGVQFEPGRVNLDYSGVAIVRQGRDAGTLEEAQVKPLKEREIQIDLDLGSGPGAFTIWTCDLSYEYVKINADYHT